jgi:hypothetical protein
MFVYNTSIYWYNILIDYDKETDMEYLVFSIYLIIACKWVRGYRELRSSVGGYRYCKTASAYNIIFGMIGLLVFSYFIRDNGITPSWAFWTGYVGFLIIILTGLYYFFKMIASKAH